MALSLRLDAKRNVIRSFVGSLREAASGMHPYKNFCTFIGRPAFTAKTGCILIWGGLFRQGRTFAQYIALVVKAAILLCYPTDWLSPAAKSVARGLKNSHDLPIRLQNFMFASGSLRLSKPVL